MIVLISLRGAAVIMRLHICNKKEAEKGERLYTLSYKKLYNIKVDFFTIVCFFK